VRTGTGEESSSLSCGSGMLNGVAMIIDHNYSDDRGDVQHLRERYPPFGPLEWPRVWRFGDELVGEAEVRLLELARKWEIDTSALDVGD